MRRSRADLTTIAALTGLLAALPATAVAATSASGTQEQTADVTATLEATFPAALSWGTLAVGGAGSESAEQVLNVKSNKPWGVKLASDAVSGRMRVWNGSAYAATTLTNALEWRLGSLGGAAQSTSYAAISATAATAATAQASTSDAGVNLGVRYRQAASYADAPAPTLSTYRIVVTYDAAQGF